MSINNNLPPEADPASIGNILVEMKLLTAHELIEIVKEFKNTEDELLGEFIIRKTSITEDHIQIALVKQEQLRGNVDDDMVTKVIEIAKARQRKLANGVEELNKAVELAKQNGW